MHKTDPLDLSHHILTLPILIVDDANVNRVFLEKTLRSQGFSNILCAASAEEAQVVMSHFQPEMVLLDILMPGGMDGFTFCEALRREKQYADLPILIQTTITEPELRVKAFSKGATDFVSKPVHAQELCARVKVHLEKRLSLKTLQLYKNRIEAELESAHDLQLGILPKPSDIESCRKRLGLSIASYFEPSSEIGGDFWGLRPLASDMLALWLVDFSGHGMAAALNTFRLHAYLQEQESITTRPGEYLSFLNDKLLHLLQRGQFATMFYGVIDPVRDRMLYACACMPPPIILRKATGKAEMMDGSGNPLGIGMHAYMTQSVPFASRDLLLLYSDALVETPNASGDYISEADLMGLLEKNSEASPETLKEILLAYFKTHAGDLLPDDLTIVLCTRS